MTSRRNIDADLSRVQNLQSVRRAGGWMSGPSTTTGKALMGVISAVFVCGIVAAVAVPFVIATAKAESENTEMTTTTVTTSTITTATTSTTTTTTTRTSTSTSVTTTSTSTSTSTTSTSTTSTSTSSTSTSTSTTSSTTSTSTTSTSTSTTSTSTSTSTTSTTSSATTSTTTSTTTSKTTTTSTTTTTTTTSTTSKTTTTSTTTTSTTTTTTTSTIGCISSGTTTQAPGGRGGASVLYTFDNTPNDYYGNYNAVPVNNPQYVSPGYNGLGYAIQLLSTSSQYLDIANYMNFYQRSLTVEAWIYPLAVYTGNPYVDMLIYGQTNASTFGQYMWMMLRNGSNYGAFYANDVWGPTLFTANQWQHMAFTYDYSTQTQVAYINGVVDATHTNSPPCLITAGVQSIGRYPGAAGGFFYGYIDQLGILFNRAKTAAEILDDATLVAYYSMDCATYPSWDSGPNQIPATAVGVVPGDGGRVRQSYVFNSNSAYFQATGLVLLGQAYSPYSFAVWLRPIVSVTNGGTILHVSQTTTGTGWCIPFLGLSSSGQIVANGYTGSTVIQVTGPVLTVGFWVHIAQTYSQTNGLRLYVNGALYAQSSPYVYGPSGVPMTVTLGQSLSGTGCFYSGIVPGNYKGEIDEFYIYSRELSVASVTALANP